ncbi:MAG: TerB family tellurite resistance protein [Pseudomonadota bacterium]
MLKRLFGRKPAPATAPSPQQAVAQLLLEIARSDLSITHSEMQVIRVHLSQAYGLTEAQLDALIEKAETHVEQAVSLHDTVKTVNALLSADQKSGLIRGLWRVAYADQRLDAHEEALLRRLADLLYVEHAVFIREKLTAQPSS